MTSKQLDTNDVLTTLSQHHQTIQNFGVRSLALFGSVARGHNTTTSDLDFLVEFEGETTFDRYMDLKFWLEDLFNKPVDLVTKRSLRKEISQKILQEAIDVT
jgi:predicted nucleotidyltransferase